MKKANSLGQGLVMPAGSAPVTALSNSELTLVVMQVQTHEPLPSGPVERDIPEVQVQYPDGFIKWHEAGDLASLMDKITMTLRAKYGVASFSVASVPASLKAGEIELEGVTYGK